MVLIGNLRRAAKRTPLTAIGDKMTNGNKKSTWWKIFLAFVLGGSLGTILDLPQKITSFRNALSGKTPVERVLQTETSRSISDDLKLILADVNPQSLSNADKGGVVIPLTVSLENLRRLEYLDAIPGFSEIARLHIDRTSILINGFGISGRFNDVNTTGQLVPVDVELLKPIR